MKPLSLTFSLFLVLCFFCACHKDSEIRPEILEVEALVDSLPEEAYKMLTADTFNMDGANEAERMKYALLKNKVEDKLYQEHTNDSTMKVVVEYYEKHGTWEEKIEAYYQLASTYRDMHDAPKAVDYYTQAMMIGEEHPKETKRKTLMRVYSQLAWILHRLGDTQQELALARKKSRLYNDENYYFLQELGSAFRHNGLNDSASYYLRAARTAVDRIQPSDTAAILDTYGSGLAQAMGMGDTAAARECYNRLCHFSNDALPVLALTGKSYYFEGVNDDSVRYFLEGAYRKDFLPEKRVVHAERLSHYYYRKGNLKKAMEYSLARDTMYSTSNRNLQLQQASNAYNQYIYYRDMQKEQEMKNAKIVAERNLAISLLLLVLCAFGGYQIYRYYRRKNRMLEEKAEWLTINRDTLLEKLQYQDKTKVKIDGEQLRARLHRMAKLESKESAITQELLDQVIAYVTEEEPEFSTKIVTNKVALKSSDMIILYLRKIGMNQTETAKLLGRSRSTVCHRLNVLDAELIGETSEEENPS